METVTLCAQVLDGIMRPEDAPVRAPRQASAGGRSVTRARGLLKAEVTRRSGKRRRSAPIILTTS
jgi:hypothetical protein